MESSNAVSVISRIETRSRISPAIWPFLDGRFCKTLFSGGRDKVGAFEVLGGLAMSIIGLVDLGGRFGEVGPVRSARRFVLSTRRSICGIPGMFTCRELFVDVIFTALNVDVIPPSKSCCKSVFYMANMSFV